MNKLDHAAALAKAEERCRVLEEALSKIWTAAKVYYTNERGETYIKDEDLPPVFAQTRVALEGK